MGASLAPLHEPWKRSWLWCAPGEIPTFGWIVFLHVAVVLGIVILPFPTAVVLLLALSLLFMGGLGTTVCYHRSLAHHAVKLHPVVEQVLIFFAMLNGSGNPRTWVGIHRLHHATSDRPGDISSPHLGGFWWSHLRWLWQVDRAIARPYVRDLEAFRYRIWGRLQIPILAVSTFGGGLLGGVTFIEVMVAALWVGPVRLLWALHTQCTVNSICHQGPLAGNHGSARNVIWLMIAHMGQGENWHGNHHGAAGDARLGHGWQPDIGWLIIRFLAVLGLASRVRGRGAGPILRRQPK